MYETTNQYFHMEMDEHDSFNHQQMGFDQV